jgi:hypothetical protein
MWVCINQVKRVVIIGTSVLFFGTTLSMKTKIGTPTFMPFMPKYVNEIALH